MSPATSQIETWVRMYTNDMYRFTYSRISDKRATEDIVQNTFLSAVESYSKLKNSDNPRPWLFSILKHKIADHFRSKYKEHIELSSEDIDKFFDGNQRWRPEYMPADWGDEEELLDNPEFKAALSECFKHLPGKWSAAIHLKYLHPTDSKSICSQLEITFSSFWQIIHRAKLHLRSCLEQKWFK